jgi:Cys-tRNA(Pro)/Cys-tRNA(Cys) deacylase
MRILDSLKISYTPYEYEPDENDLSGVHVAHQIGLPEDQVFKTLVANGDKTGPVVFVIPCAMELDLKKCAAISGNKRVELIAVKNLLGLTGYIRGGCSPVGMKKKFTTYFDETAELFDAITVSAGVRGCQLLVKTEEIIAATDAKCADIT